MNFTEIVAKVIDTTKREDKMLVARREVNAALVSFSSDYDFPRDIEELLVTISGVDYTQAIAYAVLPRLRKFQYIRRGGTQQYLSALDPAKQFRSDCDLRDKYYLIGSGVRISMTALSPTLDVGFWQYPPTLTDAAPDHWMLEGNWPAIMNRAIAKIFADIGDDASSSKHERYAVADFLTFRSANIR